MHIAKCEGCEKEVEFETYKHDWPEGWTQTGRSRWGKKYHRQGGYGWWCPECDYDKCETHPGGMRDRIAAILEAHLSATDEWDGAKLANWRYGNSVVVDGIDEAADEIMELIGGSKTTDPITLQGYNYPPTPLADVIAHEARRGRTVNIVIRHAGGWAVPGGADCRWDDEWSEGFLDLGDDKDCPVHGQKGQTT